MNSRDCRNECEKCYGLPVIAFCFSRVGIQVFSWTVFVGVFFDWDLIFSVEPAAQVDQLAPLATEGEEFAAGRGAIIRNRLLADRTFHNILPWVPVTSSSEPTFLLAWLPSVQSWAWVDPLA